MNGIENDSYILTIAIPTYNRAPYLARCLKFIKDQFTRNIELIVSDNCSTDNTTEVVKNFIEEGLPVRYIRNIENLGPDINVAQCYTEAKGKYVLVFGDDDVLLPKSLNLICEVLKENYGIVYLNFFGFYNNPLVERPRINLFRDFYLFHSGTIIKNIRSKIGFASAHIVNRAFVSKQLFEDAGTNLNHVPLILNAAMSSDKNLFIGEHYLAQQLNNSGGYDYMKVIGKNYAQVVKGSLQDERCIRWILEELAIKFFPYNILANRKQREGNKLLRNDFDFVEPYYREYAVFWIFNYPLVILPYFAATVYHALSKIAKHLFILYTRIPSGRKVTISS